MSRFTVYRTDIDSPRLARALRSLPGVSVDGDGTTASDDGGTAPPTGADDGTIPTPDSDVGGDSLVRRYGLLGLGVSLIGLGVSTVGLWLYLRRRGDGESETPPPAAEGVTGESTVPGTPSPAEPDATTPQPDSVTDETDDLSIVTSEAESEPEPESAPAGRTEGDRSDVEWTTKDRSGEQEANEETESPPEPDEEADESEDDRRESVDAAPLLGVAFVAVTGAVVRWLQSGDES